MFDVFDMITIGKISERKMLNAFGAGFQSLNVHSSIKCKLLVHFLLFFLYAGILAAYSYIVYDFDDRSKLGIVSSVAVVINDIYVYLMYNARIINRIAVLSLIMFCSRLFIMLGGANYWVYGYLVIYIWLELIIVLGIVRRRLPFNSQIEMTSENAPVKKTKFLDLARVPEFIFLVITVSIIVSIVVAETVNPRGVYLSPLELGIVTLNYWSATFLSILIVVSFLFFVAWMRAFKRRVDQTVSPIYIYLFSRKIDTYFVLCIICYILCIFWTLGIYEAYPYDIVLLSGLMVPVIAFFTLNIIQIYIRNNYYFVEDVSGMNRKIEAHNKRVDALKTKGRELRDKILSDGPEAVYGEENGRLVKKVMEIEVARRQASKLEAKINKDVAQEDE